MRQSRTSFHASRLEACGAIALLLSYIFSAAEAFTSSRGIFGETHVHQRTPLFIPSFIGDRIRKLSRRDRVASQLRETPPVDEKGETTGGGADNQDWFKMGQQMAKELREAAESAEDEREKEVTINLEEEEEEDFTVADITNSITEEVRESSTALLEAQVLSQETARALIASTACICQMKEEELKNVQSDIQNLREKLEKLEEQEVLLEEEVSLARSNQDQTVEQEQFIRESFQKLANQNKDIL